MLLADCGTVWTKIKNLEDNSNSLIKTQELARGGACYFKWSTGHMGRTASPNYQNELVALAAGASAAIEESDFTVVDVGGRDVKYCCFSGRKLVRMNWNQSCGATTGFLLDLIAKYYNVDYSRLKTASEPPEFTCGVLGIETVFDDIVNGSTPEESVARLVSGVAHNIYNFSEKPRRIYLSGGLCENKCFVNSLGGFSEVVLLGRYVLTDGLAVLAGHKNMLKGKVNV